MFSFLSFQPLMTEKIDAYNFVATFQYKILTELYCITDFGVKWIRLMQRKHIGT